MSTKADRENVWVDLVKICCVFVVAAGHCKFSDAISLFWVPDFVDCCVQILFLFSGYYMIKTGVMENRDKIRKYILHLIRMLLAWIGIYMIYGLFRADKTGNMWVYEYLQGELEQISGLDSGHLWYIEILIVVSMLLYCLNKRNFSGRGITFLLLLTGFFGTRLNRGLTGVALGIWLATKSDQKEGKGFLRREGTALLAGVVSAGLLILLHYIDFGILWQWVPVIINIWMNLTALAICRAATGYSGSDAGAKSECAKRSCLPTVGYYLRKISTCVYLSHMLFIQKGIWFSSRYTVWNSGKAWVLCSGFVIAVSVAAGIGLIWISQRRCFHWVKQLY